MQNAIRATQTLLALVALAGCAAESNAPQVGDDDLYESGFSGTWTSHGTWVYLRLDDGGRYELLKRRDSGPQCRLSAEQRVQSYSKFDPERSFTAFVDFGAIERERGKWKLQTVLDRDERRALTLAPDAGEPYAVPVWRTLDAKPLVGFPEPQPGERLFLGEEGSNAYANYAPLPHRVSRHLTFASTAKAIPVCGENERLCVNSRSRESVAMDEGIFFECAESCPELPMPSSFDEYYQKRYGCVFGED